MFTERIIVLVDDDPDDRAMLEQALREIENKHTIIEAQDGIDCIRKLHEIQEKGQSPCLIVLDINMPRMNGKQTFKVLKEHENFRDIPVVVLSTSSAESDRSFFVGHGVEYMTKPVRFNILLEHAKKMLSYCD